jgi:RHS repeat-associated protein
LYSGEQFDSKIGQQYLRQRYYNPSTGRFNRLDPFFGNLNDPLSLHKYLYTHADPINMVDPTGKMSLAGISISMAIGGGLTGAIASASISYATGVRGWRNIGASVFSGFASGAILGSAYGFSIGTGRFPIVFVEGLATASSNALSSLLSQLVMNPLLRPDLGMVGNAFIDGLVWGTAASAFGGTFIMKNINGTWKNVFEEDVVKQVISAVITSIGKDVTNYVTNSINGREKRDFSDFLVGSLINAGKAGFAVYVLNHAISESNIPSGEIAWMQVFTGFFINWGIGTWIDVTIDYVLEHFVP